MPVIEKDLGAVSAYAIAVENGYTGSEEEFALLQVESANNAQAAETARSGAESAASNAAGSAQTAQNAANSAGAAQTAAESAKTAAETANTGAQNAQTAAQQAARDAQSAQTAAQTSAAEAESAAVRAEDAAVTVESIVAGNEAYTKRESDLRFAVPIVEGASGAVVAVTDSAERPLHGLKVFGKTIQNGTPTPDAPVELVSVGNPTVNVYGKNLLNPANHFSNHTFNGIATVINPDGSITFSGTPTETTNPSFGAFKHLSTVESRKVMGASGYYTLSVPVHPDNANNTHCLINIFYNGKDHVSFFVASASNNFVSTAKITEEMLSYDDYIVKFGFWSNRGAWDNGTYVVQLEANDTATEFEPYKPVQELTVSTPNGLLGIPVTSGGNYTDENGQQWICDEVDFARGKYVRRVRKYTDLVFWTQGSSPNGYEYGASLFEGENRENIEVLSTHFVWQKNTSMVTIPVGRMVTRVGTTLPVVSCISSIATVDDFNAWIKANNVEFYSALATPVETDLPAEELAQYAALHTNYPNTTVFNDGGAGMEVAYAADTKMYIDNKFAALSAALSANQTEEVTT